MYINKYLKTCRKFLHRKHKVSKPKVKETNSKFLKTNVKLIIKTEFDVTCIKIQMVCTGTSTT